MNRPTYRGFLGLYWGPRADPFDECAQRAYASLAMFHSAGFTSYFKLGRSRSAAMKKPVAIESDTISALLRKGRIYSDIPREPMIDLGWRFSLWSGGTDAEAYSLSLHCGAYTKELETPNCLAFRFAETGRFSLAQAKDRDRACLLFDELVELWLPDSGMLQEKSTPPDPDRSPLRELIGCSSRQTAS